MSELAPLNPLPPEALEGTDVVTGEVDVRRDVYQFITYVSTYGLKRSHRENSILKMAARRLAKLLSYEDELEDVEEDGCGHWSNIISQIAREAGLVSFATEGVYQGYASQAPSFPENEIVVQDKAWKAYLAKSPSEKERTLLEAAIRWAGNEFHSRGILLGHDTFDIYGSATGPVSKMNLPFIRRTLLGLLATLRPDVWYDFHDLVERLRTQHPRLVLNPENRDPTYESQRLLREWEWKYGRSRDKKKPAKPEVEYQDIYENFREGLPEKSHYGRRDKQIVSSMPDAFYRVEGRYLEWFLQEIPHVFGFVDMAFRPESDKHGTDVAPTKERIRGVRVTQRLVSLMGNDPLFDRVNITVLPNFEILIDAPSYPDSTIHALSPFTDLVKEDSPVYKLKLTRKKVVETLAARPETPPVAELLKTLSNRPLPENVAVELEAWSGHAEKLTIYEGFGLLELQGETKDRKLALERLQGLVEIPVQEGLVLIRRPDEAFERLEEALLVPIRVKHKNISLKTEGLFERAAPKTPAPRAKKAPPPPKKVRLEAEDLIGYRCEEKDLLTELHKALENEVQTCLLAGEGTLLVLSAAGLPKLRAAIKRLAKRFDVEM